MPQSQRIPLWLKLAYTAFCAVLVPVYWRDYGPTNFLYFCDTALLMALPGLWLENALLLSAPAVGITIPQAIWVVDFVGGMFGAPFTHMTDYMFSPDIPLFTRFLSFFHCWLPFLLIWAVSRLGYDRRAFAVWTVVALVLLFVCYFLMPAPPPPPGNPNLPVNINYVYGLTDEKPQDWLPGNAWFAALLVGLPLLVYLPTHLVLRRLFSRA